MQEKRSASPRHRTSWNKVGKWYDKSVGDKGHYYHQAVVLPGLLKLLDLKAHPAPKLLDAACGQGILARSLPDHVAYQGLDLAEDLIKAARSRTKRPQTSFNCADLCQALPVNKEGYSHAVIVLALQNIEMGEAAIRNVVDALKPGGQLVIVLNHPIFRIPRQSHWGVDEASRTRYRRVDRYMSPIAIPIKANPSKGEASQKTWSFHTPLSSYFKWLKAAGCVVEDMEEWCSDKTSIGKAAKMENSSRKEFPLFMALSCRKLG